MVRTTATTRVTVMMRTIDRLGIGIRAPGTAIARSVTNSQNAPTLPSPIHIDLFRIYCHELIQYHRSNYQIMRRATRYVRCRKIAGDAVNAFAMFAQLFRSWCQDCTPSLSLTARDVSSRYASVDIIIFAIAHFLGRIGFIGVVEAALRGRPRSSRQPRGCGRPIHHL